MVYPCRSPQDTTSGYKLEPQSDDGTLDSKYSTTTHANNNGEGATKFNVMLSEMPPGDHLLAAQPGAGGGPPVGANFARPKNDQVETTEDGDTPECGRDQVAT